MNEPPESPRSEKQSLRDRIAILKKSQTQQEALEKSARIKETILKTHEFNKARTILFYAAMEGEVQTKGMMEEALSLGKRIALPKVSGKKLLLHEISSLHQLEKSGMGIPEPKGSPKISLKEIGIIILPGIAFDRSGNRLGRGEGYYDRLLSQSDPRTPRIALAFGFQVVAKVPAGANDQKIHKIITEGGIIECEKGPQDGREGK